MLIIERFKISIIIYILILIEKIKFILKFGFW